MNLPMPKVPPREANETVEEYALRLVAMHLTHVEAEHDYHELRVRELRVLRGNLRREKYFAEMRVGKKQKP